MPTRPKEGRVGHPEEMKNPLKRPKEGRLNGAPGRQLGDHMTLKLTSAQRDEIRRHGEATYPYECCGVLTGETADDGAKRVLQVVPCDNADSEKPQQWYQIDPRDLVRIQREAYERGQDIVGFYHSHPDARPRWSSSDLAEAHWLGCSYVITSVEKGAAAVTNSFVLMGDETEKRFEDEEIEVSG
jgi:proteasome lid subunit RPN8/RPN11